MSTHEAALTLGYVGAALGIAMVVPQIVRIVRNPRMPGVSPTAWALLGLGCLMWMTYGARIGVLPQIPGNIILVSGAVIVVMLIPSDRSRAYRFVPFAAAAVVLLAVAMLIPAHDVGYLGFSIGLVSSWPQVYDSIQTWRAGRTSGVSVPSLPTRVVPLNPQARPSGPYSFLAMQFRFLLAGRNQFIPHIFCQ